MEETLAWQTEMPNGLLTKCRSNYSERSNFLKAEAEKEWFKLQPAFNYSGLKGNTSNEPMDFTKLLQQAK